MQTIRVLLADDHPIFRSGLRGVLSAASGMDVIAEASDGESAAALIRDLHPDVAVLDLEMPKANGFEVARRLQQDGGAVPLVVLTAHKSESIVNKALDVGFRGYVVKDAANAEIVECIRAVHSGGHYLSAAVASFLVNRRQRTATLEQEKPGLAGLTPTERRVLRMIANQQSSRQIAEALDISVRTVEHHRSSICAKLDLKGVNALTRFAAARAADL